jgi:hypothetical protein
MTKQKLIFSEQSEQTHPIEELKNDRNQVNEETLPRSRNSQSKVE